MEEMRVRAYEIEEGRYGEGLSAPMPLWHVSNRFPEKGSWLRRCKLWFGRVFY